MSVKKSLYGLKQAPRCWNKKFCSLLRHFNFKETEADKCIFVGNYEDTIVYLALFVDDGLIAAKSRRILQYATNRLRREFRITVGDAKVFVGIQIERDRSNKSVFIHQGTYVKKILTKFKMINAKAVSIPFDPHVTLYPASQDDNKPYVPYREAIGSLIFLSTVSRPDIAFAINALSKYLNNYNENH